MLSHDIKVLHLRCDFGNLLWLLACTFSSHSLQNLQGLTSHSNSESGRHGSWLVLYLAGHTKRLIVSANIVYKYLKGCYGLLLTMAPEGGQEVIEAGGLGKIMLKGRSVY